MRAAATAKSAAGSLMRKPPATFKNTSRPPNAMPQRASKTARTIDRRALSQPTIARRGVASDEGAASAWISTRTGRVPSMPANTVAGTLSSRASRNNAEGFCASASPSRAFQTRRFREPAQSDFDGAQNAELVAAVAFKINHRIDHMFQPRGPAITSLVTWPTKMTATSLALAK